MNTKANSRVLHPAGLIIFCLPFFTATFIDAAAPADGYVVKADGPMVYVDWGRSSGIQVGDQFSIYRKGGELKHPATGEVLGFANDAVGKGVIEQLDDKFSVGRLIEQPKPAAAGDRTHWLEGTVVAPAPSEAAPDASRAPTSLDAPLGNGPKEIYRHTPLPNQAVGITAADVDGDGSKDLIVAYNKTIEVFQWKDGKLQSLGTYKDKHQRHWLGVDAADLRHAAQADIFATAYVDSLSRPYTVVIRWVDGKLTDVQRYAGFTRAIDQDDGTVKVVTQDVSRGRSLLYMTLYELIWKDDKYKPGDALNLPIPRELLFGLAQGDLDGDGNADTAFLEQGEKLRVFFKDSRYRARDVFGGTKNTFQFEGDNGQFSPRLTFWKPNESKSLLLVPHNIPQLGVRLTFMKFYKQSELFALGWDGLEMKPQWRLGIDGYLPDYRIADVMKKGESQLWVAAIGSSDKTVLIAYQLPR